MSSHLLKRQGIGASLGLVLHEASKTLPGLREFHADSELEAPGAWVHELWPGLMQAAGWPWPAPDEPALGLSAMLAARLSVRDYELSGIRGAELARWLGHAFLSEVAAPDYRPLARPHQAVSAWNGHATLVRTVLLALRVDGLPPGAYLVDECARCLRPLYRDGAALPAVLEKGCFQAEFRDAAALCLMVGSLEDAGRRYGDRGYRYLLLEAGVQLQRFGLAAATAGLGGSITGSLVQGLWDEWLGLEGFRGSVLNAYALGKPIPATGDDHE